MTSSTPKNSVNPTATSAYITPSMSPLIRYWSAMSTPSTPYTQLFAQFALAGAVVAVFPDYPLAVLHHVFRDHRDALLPTLIQGHRPADRIVLHHLTDRL